MATDSLDEAIRTLTTGELECGCHVELAGTHAVGAWITCANHRASARVVLNSVAVGSGGLIAA
jgi:hypothetical protein